MPRLEIEAQIDAAPERIFDVMTDLANVAQRISGIQNIEVLSHGPTGIGTRWRETRRLGRHEAAEEMEFTEYEPGKSFTVRCDSHGTRYVTRYLIQPEENGTRVSIDFDSKPVSVTAKIFSPIGRMMLGSVAKCLHKDLEEIKEFVEAEREPAAQANGDAIPA